MLGQVLFYLVGHQLEALKYQKNPCPKLGIYMEDDAVRMISVHASILYRISFNHVPVANCGCRVDVEQRWNQVDPEPPFVGVVPFQRWQFGQSHATRV